MIKALFKKEFIDAIRDKRSVLAALLGSFFTPLFFTAMMVFSLDKASSIHTIYVEINNQQQAPHIVEMFEQAKIIHAKKPESGSYFYLEKKQKTHSEIVVTFDKHFEQHLSEGVQAEITIIADNSIKDIGAKLQRIKRVVNRYSSELVSMKLIARGVSPTVLTPINIVDNDTSSPKSKSAMILGMLGVIILVTMFVASTNVAIDSSAGERERNSLELLLMQPISSFDVVVAKVLNATAFSIIGATLTILLLLMLIPFIPLHKFGAAFYFDFSVAMTVWFISLPLGLLAAAIQLAVAFRAKSYKEAQSYIQYTIIVPVVFPTILEITSYKHPLLSYIPIVSQQQAISQIFRGELEAVVPVVGGAVITIALALALIKYISRSLKLEKVILGL